MTNYDATKISVLKGLEAVRKNPGMYVGDTDKKGLHHLIEEIVANSSDEALAEVCDEIIIEVQEDGETISVEDNGRGIPVDMHPTEKKSALEVVMTTLHAGGKFDEAGSSYKSSGGLHGVGASCVNALSETLIAEVWRDGYLWRQSYERGTPTSKVAKVQECKKTKHGTRITWKADPSIFKCGLQIDDHLVLKRLRETAFLNRGLKIKYSNLYTKTDQEFLFTGGISDYVKYLIEGKSGLYPNEPIFVETKVNLTRGECLIQLALIYTEEDEDTILSFCNNVLTSDGGTHVSGYKTALTRTINNLGKSSKLIKENATNLTGEDVREGLVSILSVRFPRPEFVSQTKSKLGTVEIESVVNSAVYNLLSAYFDKNAGVLKKIVDRGQLAQKARISAKQHSDLVKRKGFLGKSNRMPGKLCDCNSNKMEISELFIVEGNSAAGSSKDGRDPETQAILPIRGKIINAEKKNAGALLKNKEIQSLIVAIGTGIKENFDIDKLRYNKIIIMADADDDGCHIAILLLTFIYRYMRQLITDGHIFLAQPPLYCIDHNKVKTYYWQEKDMQDAVKGFGDKSRVVRFKGLGEMDADQLAETTMLSPKRRLIKLQLNDLTDAERTISVLMGNNAQVRKEFIVNQVNSVIGKK